MKMAAQKMKEQYNHSKRDAPEFKVRDLVFLNMKNLCTARQMKKLENLCNGPFKVLKKVGASAYTLDIPEAWKRVGIHPTFNVKLLIPYHRPQFPSQQTPAPPPPDVVNDHEEYEVQEVLDSRMRRGTVQYLVKWKGYSDVHNEWVPSANCDNAKEAVEDFHRKFPQKPRPRPSTRQLFIPLDDSLRKFLRPTPEPLTEPVDDSLPTEAQLRRLYFRSR